MLFFLLLLFNLFFVCICYKGDHRWKPQLQQRCIHQSSWYLYGLDYRTSLVAPQVHKNLDHILSGLYVCLSEATENPCELWFVITDDFKCFTTCLTCAFFLVRVGIMKCCSTLFSTGEYQRRGAQCWPLWLKFQPREELEGVGVLTKVELVSCVWGLWWHQVVWGNLNTSFSCSQEPPEVNHNVVMTMDKRRLLSDFRVSRMNIPELWAQPCPFFQFFKTAHIQAFHLNLCYSKETVVLSSVIDPITCPGQGCINLLGSPGAKMSCRPLLTSPISLTLCALYLHMCVSVSNMQLVCGETNWKNIGFKTRL